MNRGPQAVDRSTRITAAGKRERFSGCDFTVDVPFLDARQPDGAHGVARFRRCLHEHPQVVVRQRPVKPRCAVAPGLDEGLVSLADPLAPFNGALDEVMLFHRALTAGEIRQLAGGNPQHAEDVQAERVLHFRFASGDTRDHSPHGNHGEFEGGTANTTEGPFGDALVFTQPKILAAAKMGRGKSKVAYLWSQDVAMMVRAMALADDRLLIAGPPDVLDEVAAFQTFADAATQQQLVAQEKALAGERGALFQIVDAGTGQTLAEYPLASPPVFDGLATAAGRVFIATLDGRVIAYGP